MGDNKKGQVEKLRGEYKNYIDNHKDELLAAAKEMKDDLDHSALLHKCEYTAKPLMIPRLYDAATKIYFEQLVDTTFTIFEKVIKEYMKNAAYRALFPFSKELEELILLSKNAASYLPLARFDIFYHEDTGDFTFCELNADGSSGMNADRLLDKLMIHNPAHQEMRYRYNLENMELFDSWVDVFLKLYKKEADVNTHLPKKPNVVITDFLDMGRLREFEEFARRFQNRGLNCEICDIRDFTFKDGELYSAKGHRVDAIYRRAVTIDILEHFDEVEAFLQAVRERRIFLAGEFCTQIVHSKWTFYVLHLPETKKLLTENENEFIKMHIPLTFPFNEKGVSQMGLSYEKILQNKDKYILKPSDGYAAKGVSAGLECTQAYWECIAGQVYGTDYICQEFSPQYESENIDLLFDEGRWKSYIHMTGLFVYNGKFSGVIARSAPAGGIIDFHRNERRQPTYFLR